MNSVCVHRFVLWKEQDAVSFITRNSFQLSDIIFVITTLFVNTTSNTLHKFFRGRSLKYSRIYTEIQQNIYNYMSTDTLSINNKLQQAKACYSLVDQSPHVKLYCFPHIVFHPHKFSKDGHLGPNLKTCLICATRLMGNTPTKDRVSYI